MRKLCLLLLTIFSISAFAHNIEPSSAITIPKGGSVSAGCDTSTYQYPSCSLICGNGTGASNGVCNYPSAGQFTFTGTIFSNGGTHSHSATIRVQDTTTGTNPPPAIVNPQFGTSSNNAIAAHTQAIGWMPVVYDNNIAGTTGQSRRLEAVKIYINQTSTNLTPTGTQLDLGIKYSAHVAGIGWQGWKYNGEIAGTTGQSRQMEAIQIQLTGADAYKFTVYYQAHVAGIGWLPYVKNGEDAGTTGQSRRMEALRMYIVPK